MFKLKQIFKVRIVYKSGYTHDFWVKNFKYKEDHGYEWESVSIQNRPLRIGADEIAAVYQIGVKYKFF